VATWADHIPAHRRTACTLCQRDLDTGEPGVYQWTSGWVMRREGGGGHGVSLPERANKWAHRSCVERAVRGLLTQTALFPGGSR
jgi:hypothetical protein